MPVFNNTVYGPGFVGRMTAHPSAGFGIDDVSTSSITVTGTVTKAGDTPGDRHLPGRDRVHDQDAVRDPVRFAPGMIQFTTATNPTFRYVLSNTTLAPRQRVSFDTNNTPDRLHAAGLLRDRTRIRVMRDGLAAEVAVEDLRVGDRAVTASGAVRPIIWIGHRVIDGAGTTLHHDQQPIHVRAGAFGAGLRSGISASPRHPVLVGADADNAGGHPRAGDVA